MPKLAPFILLATFLTHDNNFHLYLSRECEKRALHHRARVPRGCRISRPGGSGPHLRSPREPGDAATASCQACQSPLLAWSCGEPLAKERRETGLPLGKPQEAPWMGGCRQGRVVTLG